MTSIISPPWDIRDKVVLVTGATDGIGKEVALGLARLGAEVVFTARNKEKGEAVRKHIVDATGNGRVSAVVCDLASLQSVRDCARDFLNTHQSLHVLINNAGVMPPRREESRDGIELAMAVNYLAPVLLTETLVPLLKRSAPARIINVVSTMHKEGDIDPGNLRGEGPYSHYGAYAASKLALVMYTSACREALAQSAVAVSAVHPGWIKTKLALGTLGARGIVKRAFFALTRMHAPAHGALPVVRLAAAPTPPGALYYERDAVAEPSPKIKDALAAARLGAKTREILAPYL